MARDGATDAQTPPRRRLAYHGGVATSLTVPIHRLSFEDVLAMAEAGILAETARVELEGGVLVDMVPTGGAHDHRVEWLTRHFARAVPDELAVRVQSTFRIADGGFYVPDLMVLRRTGDDLPRTALLVVEVALSSRQRDAEKAATYAAAGVTEYWIVDPRAGEAVVHARPSSSGYATALAAHAGERLRPPFGDTAVDVAEMLGA